MLQSQKDPREYGGFLDGLQAMEEWRAMVAIDKHLHRPGSTTYHPHYTTYMYVSAWLASCHQFIQSTRALVSKTLGGRGGCRGPWIREARAVRLQSRV